MLIKINKYINHREVTHLKLSRAWVPGRKYCQCESVIMLDPFLQKLMSRWKYQFRVITEIKHLELNQFK